MIVSWKHKGLQSFFEKGSQAGIQPAQAKKLRDRLTALNEATDIQQLNFPAYRLHQLVGDKAGIWSITVTANWRITFMFQNGDAYIVNYEDYH